MEELGDFIGYYYCDDVVDDSDCGHDTIEKGKDMLPTIEEAKKELEIAGELNPGPWTTHSINVGIAARNIAQKVPGMDAEKAYIVGMLHDIGRRVGIVNIPKHVTIC